MKALICALLVAALCSPALAADGGASTDAKILKVTTKAMTPGEATKAALKLKDVKPPAVPGDAKGIAEGAGDAVKAAKSGQWWYFSALVILVLMGIGKVTGVLAKLGRLKYVIVPVLSIAAALLAAFQGGVSVQTAIGVATAGTTTALLEELWNHGILNKPRGSKKS